MGIENWEWETKVVTQNGEWIACAKSPCRIGTGGDGEWGVKDLIL